MKAYYVSRKKVKSKDGSKTYYFADFTNGENTFTVFLPDEIYEKILESNLICGDSVQLEFEPNIYNSKLNFNLTSLVCD